MDQKQLSSEEQTVWDVIMAFNEAFTNNDPQKYFVYIHDDITVFTPGNPYRIEGVAADREGFEYGLKRGHDMIGYFQVLQPEIRVFGESALVTYHSRGSYGTGDSAKTLYLKETDCLIKQNGQWKIVHIHVSSVQ